MKAYRSAYAGKQRKMNDSGRLKRIRLMCGAFWIASGIRMRRAL
jgi:hypothetical protein